jgi:hypothetical protein
MAARGDVEAMAMYGRRPRKILQNRVELLTYETVREALLVADQLAQSDDHRQAARHVVDRILRHHVEGSSTRIQAVPRSLSA